MRNWKGRGAVIGYVDQYFFMLLNGFLVFEYRKRFPRFWID